jgi:hypothetical protein
VKTLAVRTILSFAIALPFAFGNAWASDQEWWDAARKATCPELVDAYKTTTAAERKVVAAIKSSKDGTVASNALGVATLAIFGIGFFTWNNEVSAEENLADLRNDLHIIKTVAAEKKCALPATA